MLVLWTILQSVCWKHSYTGHSTHTWYPFLEAWWGTEWYLHRMEHIFYKTLSDLGIALAHLHYKVLLAFKLPPTFLVVVLLHLHLQDNLDSEPLIWRTHTCFVLFLNLLLEVLWRLLRGVLNAPSKSSRGLLCHPDSLVQMPSNASELFLTYSCMQMDLG